MPRASGIASVPLVMDLASYSEVMVGEGYEAVEAAYPAALASQPRSLPRTG